MLLSEQPTGAEVVVVKVKGYGEFRRRILEMGFVKGKVVKVIKNAPLYDPVEYQVLGYKISLRRSEASLIEVHPLPAKGETDEQEYLHTTGQEGFSRKEVEGNSLAKVINIALVGNPNAGKTTLFNALSGEDARVGNYSGVTVAARIGRFSHKGYDFNLTDLPGTYSIGANSTEEMYVRQHLRKEKPDIVLNVVSASNLERNLYLTTQLIDMDLSVVVALNMYDELQKSGDTLDHHKLAHLMGIPFSPVVSSKEEGLEDLLDSIIEAFEGRSTEQRHIHIYYGDDVEAAISKLQPIIREDQRLTSTVSPRYLSLKLLEGDPEALRIIAKSPVEEELKKESKERAKRIENAYEESVTTQLVNARYGFISGGLKLTYQESPKGEKSTTSVIDSFVTHRLWGYPIFILLMFLTFYATFTLGAYPQEWLELATATLGEWVSGLFSNDGPLKSLIVDGAIGGVGSVLVFMPNILLLYFFMSFMEDSGYMARAAFIMDKLMHKMGLHGKSFIPLLMGFGCNVPAISATRTIENKNDRLLTILINPLMSCSARLVVYLLFAKAFFPEHASLVLISIYVVGVLLAVIIARIFKRFLFKKEEAPFVMELPPYRIPTLKTTLRRMWAKGNQYLKKMGGLILVASIVIWFLQYFPRNEASEQKYAQELASIEAEHRERISGLENENEKNWIGFEYKKQVAKLNSHYINKHQEESYIGQLGHGIEPVMRPIGLDWKAGVSLLSGVVAKEVVLSTMGVLYTVNQEDLIEGDERAEQALIERIRSDRWGSGDLKGQVVFTPLVAYVFLLFVLIYFPCLAVVGAVRTETNSWGWAIFAVVYSTTLAWVVSFVVYQVGSLFL